MTKSLTTMVLIAMALASSSASAQMTANCMPEQIPHIAAAQTFAGLEVITTNDYVVGLQGGSGDPTRFDHWIGSHEPEILENVSLLLTAVYAGIDEITYNCACDMAHQGDYAYVNRNDSTYQVYLCPQFFMDSNFEYGAIGTVIHEISHFAGTIDCMDPDLTCSSTDPTPGTPTLAHEFAQRDPQTAQWNAYNLENLVTEGGM